jgi:hypothetical protein
MNRKSRQSVAFIYFLIFVFLFSTFSIGCGGGGGNGDSIAEPETQKSLKVTPKQAVPGTFLAIEDDSISGDSSLEVTFSDASGFKVVLETALTEPGKATIALPPLIDIDTGEIKSGNLTVSLANGKKAEVTIDELPALADIDDGYVVEAYLQQARDDLEANLAEIISLAMEYQYDTTELESQVQIQIDLISDELNELRTQGTLTVYSHDSGKLVLSADELKKVDQLLFAILYGIHAEAGSSAIGSALSNATRSTTVSLPPATQNLINSLVNTGDIQMTIRNGQIVLIGFVGSIVTIAGAMGAAPIYGTTLIAILAGGASILVIGPAMEGLDAIQARATGKVYRWGRRMNEEIRNAVKGALTGLGSALSDVINTISFYGTNSDMWKSMTDLICSQDKIPMGWSGFCPTHNAENSPDQPSTVSAIQLLPTRIKDGDECHLYFKIKGNGADTNTITIDWDDGNVESFTWGSGQQRSNAYGIMGIAHQYELFNDSDKEFIVEIRATGDNYPGIEATASAKILVKRTTYPMRLTAENQPTALDVNERGRWVFTIEGGRGPHQATIDWDDGVVQKGSSNKYGFKGSHTYKKERIYTISLTVTDDLGAQISETFPIQVGDTAWEEERCDDGIDNDGDGKIDEADGDCSTPAVPTRPNWDNGCVDDNSQNTGGATAIWDIGNSSPYPASGLICSDRDGNRWVNLTGLSGTWNLVREIQKGGADPTYSNCYLGGDITLESGYTFGVDWFCTP